MGLRLTKPLLQQDGSLEPWIHQVMFLVTIAMFIAIGIVPITNLPRVVCGVTTLHQRERNLSKKILKKAWYEEIDNGSDLLNKKLTRSTTLVFIDAHFALEDDLQTTKSISNKRKRCSTTSPDPPSVTAKKNIQNVEASYWETTEARKLFRPIAKE